ncbi:MAG TPA: hypothetical protein VIH57_15245, partial [Bacteroidales bacterium]
MTVSEVIFYQSNRKLSERWLKNSLLFWDKINTVTPFTVSDRYLDRAKTRTQLLIDAGVYSRDLNNNSPEAKNVLDIIEKTLSKELELREFIDKSNDSDLVQILKNEKIVVPLLLTNNTPEVLKLTENIKMHINDMPGIEHISYTEKRKINLLLLKTYREYLEDLIHFYPDEIPQEITIPLDLISLDGKSNYWTTTDWVKLTKPFLDNFYSSLAVAIAENQGLPILTDNSDYFQLSNTNRLSNNLEMEDRAQGILYNMLFKKISLDDSTPIEKILKFKEVYKGELNKFREEVSKLSTTIDVNQNINYIKRQADDIFKNKIMLSQDDIKKALTGFNIKWASENVLKIGFLS